MARRANWAWTVLAAACGASSGGVPDAPQDAPGTSDVPGTTDDAPQAPRDGAGDSADRTDMDAPDVGAADVAAPDLAASDMASPDAGDFDATPPDAGVCGDLRLWYRFEETGGPTFDWSGCGNDGTPAGVTRGQAGRVGNSYLFNAPPGITTAHVLVPDAPSLSDLGMLTVEAWVRHTGGILEAVLDHGDATGGDPFIFHTFTAREPALTLGFYPTCDGMGSSVGGVPLAIDTWTHVAVTVNNTTAEVRYYQEGEWTGSGTGYMNMGHMCDNAEPMIVGGIDTAGNWGWEGWIDELRVWAVVRTQAEICTDAGGIPGPGTCSL